MILYLDKLSAMLQLIFFLLKLSLAAPKIATYHKKKVGDWESSLFFLESERGELFLSHSPPWLHTPRLLPSL